MKKTIRLFCIDLGVHSGEKKKAAEMKTRMVVCLNAHVGDI